jgi:hypothetical protein
MMGVSLDSGLEATPARLREPFPNALLANIWHEGWAKSRVLSSTFTGSMNLERTPQQNTIMRTLR